MGAIRFSIDPALAELVAKELSVKTFVETGTYEGDSIWAVQSLFEEIHSIELSEELYERATGFFAGHQNVELHQGRSEDVLKELRPRLNDRNVLYWLDAHWSDETASAGANEQCPLLHELEAIESLNEGSVVMIDDARLFLSPPPPPADAEQWPAFHEVEQSLRALSPQHELIVVDDVLVFYPRRARAAVREYAREKATDWLVELQQARSLNSRLHEIEFRLQALPGEIQKQLAGVEAQMADQLNSTQRSLAEQLTSVQQGMAELNEGSRAVQKGITQLSEEIEATAAELRAADDEIQQKLEVLVAAHRRRRRLIRPITFPFRLLEIATRRPRSWFAQRSANQRARWGVRREQLRFEPKLGRLQHHPPIPIDVPERYRHEAPPSDAPTISIVTPSFNQGYYIERTVDSVVNQDYPELQYIVQDGASTDGTRQVLERIAGRLDHWDSRPDEGQAHAINLGFRHASGEIMAYLNADDLLLPGSLHYVGRYFARHPKVDVVYGHRVLIDEHDREIGRWILPRHSDKALSWADFIPQETLFWRRRTWEAVGGEVSEDFRFAMDWDLVLRFRDAGAKIVRVPRFLGAFRIHADSKTKAELNSAGSEEMAKIRAREHDHDVSPEEINDHLRGYLRRHVMLHKLYRAGVLKY